LSFGSPLLLTGLLLLPLLVVGYRYLQRRPNRYAVRYTNLDVLAAVVDSTRSWRRHAGLALFLLALVALLVGFARPSVNRLADREEATIVLVIDVSGSMQAKDVEPTRLAAAQKVVRDFMK
jgi:Ca-activated chloride channel family protein